MLLQSLASFAVHIEIKGIPETEFKVVRRGEGTSDMANTVLRWLALE